VVGSDCFRFADKDEAAGAADATACVSLRWRWSLEGVTAPRYDDVAMIGDATNISMSINNGLLAQLPMLQRLPNQSRFKSHSAPRPPQTPAPSS
jgi:hypothetical protein